MREEFLDARSTMDGGKGRRGKNFNATSRGSIVVFWKYCCSQMLPPFNAVLFFLSKGQS